MTKQRSSKELVRYGVCWRGPTEPICKPMIDGFWTPWSVAQQEIERLQRMLSLASGVAREAVAEIYEEHANVAPIAKITVRDDKIESASLYAPGLPDGEHDLFCEPN